MGSRGAGPLLVRAEETEAGLLKNSAAKHPMAAGDAPWRREGDVDDARRCEDFGSSP
jgi:hypothetical protein